MKANTKLLLCMMIGLICAAAGARVVPYTRYMAPPGDALLSKLTVPAGKVVVFDHMQSTARTVTVRLNYSNADSGIDAISGAVVLSLTNPTPGYVVAMPVPIRLYAGWTITNQTTSLIDFFGLAMDDDDLYAGVGNEIDSLRMADGTLLGGIQLDSPRPVIAEVERSEDLGTWAEDAGAEVEKGAEPAKLEFEAGPTDAGAFYRVKARAVR